MSKQWMAYNKILVTLGLAFLASTLRADVQDSFNVAANALAASHAGKVKQLQVADFIDQTTGQPSPISEALGNGLRQALSAVGQWKVLDEGVEPTDGTEVLSGTFQENGDQVQVHIVLQSQPDGPALWSRNVTLASSDLTAKDAAPAAQTGDDEEGGSVIPGQSMGEDSPGMEGDVIPSLPVRRYHEHYFHFDLSAAYKAFFPTNTSFRSSAGNRMDAFDLGMSFNDFLLLDVDFWDAPISNVGTVQDLEYAGTDLDFVYPFHLGAFTLYAGPGGRFGSIQVDDTTLPRGSIIYGNNGFTAVAGAKVKVDHVGIDLRYTYDLISSYTGYNTARLGVFYEFGR